MHTYPCAFIPMQSYAFISITVHWSRNTRTGACALLFWHSDMSRDVPVPYPLGHVTVPCDAAECVRARLPLRVTGR